jgi:spore germination cell wall hydrolase CwlJ-like protein
MRFSTAYTGAASLLLASLLLAAPTTRAVVHPLALYYDHLGKNRSPDHTAELHCLALEARGEDDAGRLAVAAVTMNRLRSATFPSTVCDVVWQPWQFSWTRDGRSDRPAEVRAWRQAIEVATRVYEFGQGSNVGDATFYHNETLSPHWARSMRVVARIGRHLFFAPKGT